VTSIAHQSGTQAARSPLPSWRAALTAAFLGWFLAWFAVGALAAVAWELGLVARPSGGGLRDWPYPEAGWQSVVANSIVWFSILAATALLVRGLLADRVERPVSAAVVFLILLATGFAPFLPHGLLNLPWLVGLIVTAALLRLAPGAGPAPLPKRTTAKLTAVGAALLVIPAAHGILHPLWPSPSFLEPMPTPSATFWLRNAGFAAVELESVSLRTPVPLLQLADVRVDDFPPVGRSSRGLPFELEARSEAFVQLRLRHPGCGTGPPLRGQALLRYRVYGLRRTETLPVPVLPRRC
jgi:hypothetical protein